MKGFLLFTAGVISGFGLGCLACKKRYEEIMEEDRQSRRRVREKKPNVEEEKKKYQEIIKLQVYTGSESENDKDEANCDPDYEEITMHFFDTLDDYVPITLEVYPNGVVTDDAGDQMTEEDVLAAIGRRDPMTLFKNGEEVAYIRNHARKVDYELIKEEEDYEE